MFNEEAIGLMVKDVGIYLRKSRTPQGVETDDALIKHKKALIQLAQERKYRFVLYEEVVSGEKLSNRPQMLQLLQDIENDMFDAVLVMDIDRLGRGDVEEWGKIKNILLQSDTPYIITPSKLWDLTNDEDDTMIDVRAIFARMELKQIKKRLRRGKRQAAEDGKWTDGRPPIPYDLKEGKLVVDDNKLIIYNMIKDMCLKQLLPTNRIAYLLNQKNIPSPKGGLWHHSVVRDLLKDETHLGRIIYGKTKKTHKGRRRVDRINWIIVEGCHDAVKTPEEHEMILKITNGNILPMSRNRGSTPRKTLQGIVVCGVCGSVMQSLKNWKENRTLICVHRDKYGNKCANKGLSEKVFLGRMFEDLSVYANEEYASFDKNKDQLKLLQDNLGICRKKEAKINKIITNLQELVEDGTYSREEYKTRKTARILELEGVKRNIDNYQSELAGLISTDDRKDRIGELLKAWDSLLSPEEKNLALRKLISKIELTRDRDTDEITLRYHFL